MFSAFGISRHWAVLIAAFLLTSAAEAHVVKQIYAKFTAGADKWQADVNMDAGYAWPEYRDDPDAPQPTLEWLEARPPRDFAVLRRESEALLRRHLEFRAGETPLTWTCRFPDFDSFPPDFPEITGGGAFLTVRIEGPLPPAGAPLTVKELTRQLPDFVFQTGEDQFPTLEPGKILTLFNTPDESNLPVAVQWIWYGFTHSVLTGWDFALFIMALILPDRRVRPIVMQYLAYVAGSSAGLLLIESGVVHLSLEVSRPLAGLSLALVAADNLWRSQGRRRRQVIVFVLSLLQGLALAGPLFEKASAINLKSLLVANVGVGCAVAVVLLVWALLFHFLIPASRKDQSARDWNLIFLLLGVVLFIQRVIY